MGGKNTFSLKYGMRQVPIFLLIMLKALARVIMEEKEANGDPDRNEDIKSSFCADDTVLT